ESELNARYIMVEISELVEDSQRAKVFALSNIENGKWNQNVQEDERQNNYENIYEIQEDSSDSQAKNDENEKLLYLVTLEM
ncbi:14891_t:CDS:1, partial [Racocetra fulgida]